MSALPDKPITPAQGQEFARYYSAHARDIYTYIFSLLSHWADADEVFQEVSTILWQKLDEFEPGTNFLAWAKQIARYEVLDYRKRGKRRPALQFGDEFIDVVDQQMAAPPQRMDTRLAALDGCLDRLAERDQLIVKQYYHAGSTAQQIAEGLGRGVDTVYKALQRIHRALLECVDRQTREERP